MERMMDREKLGRASIRLKVHLFGQQHSVEPLGFVGIAPPDTIHVYLHCGRRTWRGPKPMEWEGAVVHWHYNVGPIIAAFDREVAQ
jgi:hypothetical protein